MDGEWREQGSCHSKGLTNSQDLKRNQKKQKEREQGGGDGDGVNLIFGKQKGREMQK